MLSLAVTAFSWRVGTVIAGSAGLWVTVTWNVLQASVMTCVFMVLEEAV